jgi:TolB-like protein
MNKTAVFFLGLLAVPALCAGGAGSAGAVEKIYMPFFEMINVHPDYQYSTARLFKGYVEETGRYELVIPERSDALSRQQGLASIRTTAGELGCAYYLVGDMNRIGETVILTLSMYTTMDGKRVWGDKLKAANPEDLDPIFQKLARAVGSADKAAEDGDIYSVTSFESRELRQVQVRNSIGLSIGGAFFTPGLLYGKTWNEPFVGGLGAIWAYDSRTVLFEVEAELYSLAQHSRLGEVSISAFKPVYAKKVTPFFGGGVGVGTVGTEYQGESSNGKGLLLHAGGGVILNRNSNVQLRLQGRYVVGLFAMDAPRNDPPRAVIARMELTFGR